MKLEFDKLYESVMNEIYSSNNMYFKKYLSNKAIEYDDIVINWMGKNFLNEKDNSDILKTLALLMKTTTRHVLELTMSEPYEIADYIDKLPKDMKDRTDEAVDMAIHGGRVYQGMDSEMPTRYHMDFNELIKRTTWLIHFTNDPDKIKKEGFKYGTDDMSKLGLTTYYKKESKKYGGYNFAFEADSRYASHAASDEIYGNHAVMFKNAGVKTWHHGDEEEQVVFWGPDVKPADIVVLYRGNDDWSVARQDKDGIAFKASDSGDFDKVVTWVMNNFDQYRKIIA